MKSPKTGLWLRNLSLSETQPLLDRIVIATRAVVNIGMKSKWVRFKVVVAHTLQNTVVLCILPNKKKLKKMLNMQTMQHRLLWFNMLDQQWRLGRKVPLSESWRHSCSCCCLHTSVYLWEDIKLNGNQDLFIIFFIQSQSRHSSD